MNIGLWFPVYLCHFSWLSPPPPHFSDAVGSGADQNSPVTSYFPAQRASHAENFSIWWRHHAFGKSKRLLIECSNIIPFDNLLPVSLSQDIHNSEISWFVKLLTSRKIRILGYMSGFRILCEMSKGEYNRLSIYRGYIWYDSAYSTSITMVTLRSNLYSRTTPHTSPLTGRGMGCLSWVIRRKITAIYRERTVHRLPQEWKHTHGHK